MQGTLPEKPQQSRGFTILELLVSIIIIGILTTIAITLIANRTANARLARAQQDLENIANSMERVAIDTGYYVRMFMLDDTIGGDVPPQPFIRPPDPDLDRVDGVRDYDPNDTNTGYFLNHDQLFLLVDEGLLVSQQTGSTLLTRLQQDETSFNWNGPYINWQVDENQYLGDLAPYPDGLPDDPWGNNYLFFTREGLVREPDGDIVVTESFPLNQTPIVANVETDVFDRATVLSLGPNGLPGNGNPGDRLGTGDDLSRSFGR